MKRFISLFLSAIVFFSFAAGFEISADALTNLDFDYSFCDGGAISITAYNGSQTNVVIPDEIDGYIVKNIGESAFENCNNLISVTIPSSVESINWFAFNHCSKLKNLIISEGVTEICQGAFNECSSLTNVVLPETVTLIDVGAFSGCAALTSINIPQNVEIIGCYAFQNCSNLSSITVDENNEYYDSRNNCNAVIETDSDILVFGCKNTVIPNGITEIGEGAFDGCTQLESISIPDTVISIGDYAFEGCTGMQSVNISANASFIGISAFDWCTSLVGITLPKSVETIDSSAFDHCNSLQYIAVLNEDCYIEYDEYTITDTAHIYGYTDSSAQDYAEDYDRTFMPLEKVIPAVNMPAVKNVNISNITTTGATVKYDAVAGASGYLIQYLQNGNWIDLITVTETTATLNKLQSGAAFSIRVCAYTIINGKKIYSNNSSETCSFKALGTYTIDYNSNGGSEAPVSQTKTQGIDLKLSSTVPTKAGYTFLGWSTNRNATSAEFSAGGTYTLDQSKTLYAVWQIKTYEITYDSNGGAEVPAAQSKINSVDLILSSTKPTRTGYTFLGWSTNKNAISADFSAGGVYTSDQSARLYAVWKADTYTVNYNVNGGTGTFEPQIKTHGVDLKLSSTVPTKAGYTFLGWSTNKNATSAEFSASGIYTSEKNTTLYAVWKIKTYKITYDANGGIGAPDSQIKTYGVDLELSSTVPAITGNTFLGWSTNENATSAEFSAGGIYTLEKNTTLYAVWKIKTYKITYDANGGTGTPDSQIKTHGVDLELSSTIPVKAGYTFLGWATNENATSAEFSPDGMYTSDQSTRFYAVWKANTYTVKYDANGGAGTPDSQIKTHGVDLKLSSTVPIKSNCTFLGWSTNRNATSAEFYPDGIYTLEKNTTLYAVWKIKTYKITYDANGGAGTPDSQNKTHGVDLELSSMVPVKTGYTFLGWSTNENEVLAEFSAGGTYTADSDATLYAVWSKMSTVSNVQVSNLSTTGVKLSWNAVADASGYEIQYFLNENWKTMCEVTETSKTFTQLTSNRFYIMRIRVFKTVNGTKTYSNDWSDPIGFSTYTTSDRMTFSNLSTSGAKATLKAVTYAGAYEIQYWLNGKWVTMCEIANNTKTFTQLTANRLYTMRFRAFKTVDGIKVYSSNWSAPYSFTTYATVSRMSFSNINSKGATLEMNSINQAGAYEIQYLLNGQWKTMCEVAGNTKTFTQLTSNRKYTMRIRAFKTVNGTKSYSSNWSAPYSFTTLN